MVLALPSSLWTGYPVSENRPFTPYWTGIATGCKTLRKSREVSLGEDLMGWGTADHTRPCQLVPTSTAHTCLRCPPLPCSAPRGGDPQALQQWGSDVLQPPGVRPMGRHRKRMGDRGSERLRYLLPPPPFHFATPLSGATSVSGGNSCG